MAPSVSLPNRLPFSSRSCARPKLVATKAASPTKEEPKKKKKKKKAPAETTSLDPAAERKIAVAKALGKHESKAEPGKKTKEDDNDDEENNDSRKRKPTAKKDNKTDNENKTDDMTNPGKKARRSPREKKDAKTVEEDRTSSKAKSVQAEVANSNEEIETTHKAEASEKEGDAKKAVKQARGKNKAALDFALSCNAPKSCSENLSFHTLQVYVTSPFQPAYKRHFVTSLHVKPC